MIESAETVDACGVRFCVIGGWAVYLLTEIYQAQQSMPALRHQGSFDVDLSLVLSDLDPASAQAVAAALRAAGYQPQEHFRWFREMPSGSVYDLDLMAPPPEDTASGQMLEVGGLELGPFWNGEVAVGDTLTVLVQARVSDDTVLEAKMRVAGAAGLFYAKAQVAFHARDQSREKRAKHLYDLFCLARTYPGGPPALAERLHALYGSEEIRSLHTALEVGFGRGTEEVRMVAEMLGLGGTAAAQYQTEVEVTMGRLVRALGR